ncbi:hypothetical protein D6827_01220 [Candidatus Parcubacteria bacterium]|nr:MAG: hypothetical protein D6827_01220 [Candidatus Parcubacteria bacterium]
MSNKLVERLKIANASAPNADIFANPTDVFLLKNYDKIVFAIFGVATTATGTVTVEECDDTTPTNSTAIAFTYYANTSADTSDDFGAATSATASGFTTATSSTYIYLIEVKADQLSDGYPGVRLNFTAGGTGTVTGAILAILGDARYEGDPNNMLTAIS